VLTRNRAHWYYSPVKRCRGCEQKPQCTRGKFRTIAIHTCEAARQKADEKAKTPEFAVALRQRRKVEALFSELKEPGWIAALAPMQNQVRAGAVLPSCRGTEPETTGAVPQQESATSDGNRVRNRPPEEKHKPEETLPEGKRSSNRLFQQQRLTTVATQAHR
jgi:hypothetical protein